MRVLIGTPDPKSLGGPATCEPPFIAQLRQHGIDVVEETYVYGDQLGGTSLLRRAKRVVHTARRFRAIVRQERFDLVHLNTAFDVKALLRDVICVSAMRGRAPLFLKLHGSETSLMRTQNPFLRACRRMLLAQVDAFGVLSSAERVDLLALGVPADKVIVVKNAVPAPTTPVAADTTAAQRPRLLFIARMVPTKGLLDVVRACGALQQMGREFELVCVGDGPARAEAEAEASILGLGERIRFVGYIPEAETGTYYASAAALVFPTHHGEGFSITIFNAVANGLPVLTTKIRAAADYLREPDNCLWVNSHDPDGLALRVVELLDDAELQASMRRNNRELGRRFRPEAIVQEYIILYRSLSEELHDPKRRDAPIAV